MSDCATDKPCITLIQNIKYIEFNLQSTNHTPVCEFVCVCLWVCACVCVCVKNVFHLANYVTSYKNLVEQVDGGDGRDASVGMKFMSVKG